MKLSQMTTRQLVRKAKSIKKVLAERREQRAAKIVSKALSPEHKVLLGRLLRRRVGSALADDVASLYEELLSLDLIVDVA